MILAELAPEAWESFYVIVGSTAGALTGLQFVVLTLISESGMPSSGASMSAFGSPNVVHFCAALLVLGNSMPSYIYIGVRLVGMLTLNHSSIIQHLL